MASELPPEIPSFAEFDSLPVVTVAISDLTGTDSPRLEGVDPGHASLLAATAEYLPPIVVHRQTMRVIDGMHRVRAAELRGETEISARLVDCGEPTVFLLAVRANILHGLPLSLADRRAAATRIVELYPQWSDRMIAEVTGISATTVGTVRGGPAEDSKQTDSRVGRDGRVRPVDPALQREQAEQLLRDNPDATLREIAARLKMSPETVRGIRARLNGQDGSGEPWPAAPHPARAAKERRPSAPALREQHAEERSGPRGKEPALDKLRRDPAFRSTEAGRHLIRSLSEPSAVRQRGSAMLDSIPPHCIAWIAQAALECAEDWRKLADEAARRPR